MNQEQEKIMDKQDWCLHLSIPAPSINTEFVEFTRAELRGFVESILSAEMGETKK